MSKIEKYIEILELCQSPQDFEGTGDEHVDHLLLIKSGLIGSAYDNDKPYSHDVDGTFSGYNLVITPKGAIALVEWKRLLYELSIRGRVVDFIEKPLWIVFGFSIPELKAMVSDLWSLLF
jgi:hypothetical protein